MATETNAPKIWEPLNPAPEPSPLPLRECACGCGYSFYPSRRDKVYLNNQHANYGYNHNTRKLKNKKKNELNKKLDNNDRLLEKYFNALPGNPIVVLLINLIADGFLDALYISSSKENDETYYYLYNYSYTLYKKDNQTLVRIYKLRKNERI